MNTKDEFCVADNVDMKSLKKSIEDLFQIKYEFQSFENNLWITLHGHPKKVAVAKQFIKGVCSPEKQISMHYPAVIHGILKDNLWKNCLQVMTCAFVDLKPNYCLQISGLELNVLLAQSAFEELIHCFDPNKDINKSECDLRYETNFLAQLLHLDIDWDDYQCIPNSAKDVLFKWLGELNNFNSDVDSEEFKTAGCIHDSPKDSKPNVITLKDSSSSKDEDSCEDYAKCDDSDSDEVTQVASNGNVISKKRKKKRKKKSSRPGLNNIELEQERLREMYERQFISENETSPISKKLNTTTQLNLQVSNSIPPLLPSFPSTSSYPVAMENRVFKENLRPVVIDGSNVAMSHGNNKIFSCQGIDICVNYFRKRGHQNITVFIPKWRKDPPKPHHQISAYVVLNRLYNENVLKLTPSRIVQGQMVASYDDRFIVQLATEIGGVIVSNDNFRDLMFEHRDWKETIEKRLLLYTFVGDIFMPPEDPLGRQGPLLSDFLRFPQMSTNRSRMAKQNASQPEFQTQSCEQFSFGPSTKPSSSTSVTSKVLNAYSMNIKPHTFAQMSNDSSRSANNVACAMMTNSSIAQEKTLSSKLLEIFPEKTLLIDKVLKTYPALTDIMVLANHVIELE